MKHYYAILGVPPESDLESIKKAFRDKVAVLHPEKNHADNAKEAFADLIEAYEILSKPEKRKAYDALVKERTSHIPVLIEPEVKEEFEEYQKEAKETSTKYKDYSLSEFLALELFLDAGVEGLFSGGLDLLDEAGDIIGDIFDIF